MRRLTESYFNMHRSYISPEPAFLSPLHSVNPLKRYRFSSYRFQTVCSGTTPSYELSKTNNQDCKNLLPTPLSLLKFRNRIVHVKRDDLLNFHGITGSKFRKFFSLFNRDSLRDYDAVVSFGGAQSNAMLALTRLCLYHKIPFLYITRTVSGRIDSIPGNFRQALDAGMIHIQLDNQLYKDTFTDKPCSEIEPYIYEILTAQKQINSTYKSILLIPQGGAWVGSEEGVRLLANELRMQAATMRKNGTFGTKPPMLFLPSGTGTTAFYLQKHLGQEMKIVTIPVSGDERYLVKQMRWLSKLDKSPPNFPDILRPRLRGTFADIRPEKIAMWNELKRAADSSFEFDLVYAPKIWEEISVALSEGRIAQNDEDLIYYHSGGVEGNISMLGKRKSYSVFSNS